MKKTAYLIIPVLLVGCSCQPTTVAKVVPPEVAPLTPPDSIGTDVLHSIDSMLKALPPDSNLALPRTGIDLGEVEVGQ